MRKYLAVSALIASAFLGTAAIEISNTTPAQAAVTCNSYSDGGTYPADGHFFVCISNPVATRRAAILANIRDLPRKVNVSDPDLPYDVLKAQGVVFYYFHDRADGNSWFTTMNSTGRCGYTKTLQPANTTVMTIYDVCTVAGGTQFTNPSIQNTTHHESGHAYDFSKSPMPSQVTSYQTKLTYDFNQLDAGWDAMDEAHKNTRVCNLFGTIAPSNLEIDLGATPGAVCSGTTRNSAYVGKKPTEIALLKAPYFVNTTVENWAEHWAFIAGTQTGVQFLALTDKILYGSNANFICTRAVVRSYWMTNAAPTTVPTGCPAN